MDPNIEGQNNPGGRSEKKPQGMKKMQFVSIAFELGFIIALPIIIFGLIGKWLDHRFATEPAFTLIGILLAISSTSIWMYRRFKSYFDSTKQ